MTFFDLCVAGVVGFCLVFGGFRGLIREVSGIIGVVAGFYGANTYFPLLVPHIEPWISSPGIRRLACFFVLFCLILVVVGAGPAHPKAFEAGFSGVGGPDIRCGIRRGQRGVDCHGALYHGHHLYSGQQNLFLGIKNRTLPGPGGRCHDGLCIQKHEN